MPRTRRMPARPTHLRLFSNEWDRRLMIMRAQYHLTPGGLNQLLLSMEQFGRAMAGLGTTLAADEAEKETS